MLKNDVEWMKKLFWAVACIYAVVFLGAAGVFWSELREIGKSVSDVKIQISKLEETAKVAEASTQKLPITLLEATLPNKDEYSRLSEKDLVARLDRASRVVDASIASGIPANSTLLTNIKESSYVEFQRPDLPQSVRDAGISVLVRLESYEIFGRVMVSRIPIILLPPDRVTEKTTPLVAGDFPVVISGDLQRKSVIRGMWPSVLKNPDKELRLIYTPPGQAGNVLYQHVRAENFNQPLDGIKWLKVDFVDSVIRYEGGPLYLADVTFKNCRFDFGSDEVSQAFLKKIQAAGGQPVSILRSDRPRN